MRKVHITHIMELRAERRRWEENSRLLFSLTRSQLTWPNLYISNHNNHRDEIFLFIFILSSTSTTMGEEKRIHHQEDDDFLHGPGGVGVTIKKNCNQISANRQIDQLF